MQSVKHIHIQYITDEIVKVLTFKPETNEYELNGLRVNFIIEEALSGFRIQCSLSPTQPIILEKFYIEFEADYTDVKSVFSNGFQSWSESKLFSKSDIIQKPNKLIRSFVGWYGDYNYFNYPQKKGVIHSWGHTYCTLPDKKILFWGSLNEKNAFTNFIHSAEEQSFIIERDVKGWEIETSTCILDVFTAENSEQGAFQHFYLLTEYPEPQVKPATGWTSWYQHYTHISEKIVLDNLKSFQANQIPLDYFQIDDGYQCYVGDWLQINHQFPNGMKKIADEIKATGYKPGIWIAPFTVEKKSTLYKEHPDWLIKDSTGKPLRIGINPMWSMAFYALDFYHPEVRNYLKKVLETYVHEWNFDLIKIDFVFSVCVFPRNGKTRAAIMSEAIDFIRTCIGDDKIILGCGIPLGSALGKVDYCRIGPDVHLRWEHSWLRRLHMRERLSTVMAITNTINRRWLNRYAFINDPDVFILRRGKQHLTKNEQFTLLFANLVFGDLLFTSDYLPDYSEQELALFQSIFPLLKQKEIFVEQTGDIFKILFQIDDRRYLAWMNLSNHNKIVELKPGIYFDGQAQDILVNEKNTQLAKHQTILLHICSTGPFGVIGSKGHFFPGTEIEKISLHGKDIKVKIREGLLQDPEIYLKVPKDFVGTTVNGQPFSMIKKKDFAIASIKISRTNPEENE